MGIFATGNFNIKFRQQLPKIIKRALHLMESKRKKITDIVVPTNVTIEILSNGTTHVSPSIFIRTPCRCYLFNCPEGVARFLSSLRVRPNQIHDIFVTRDNWQNVGGIQSILFSRETSDERLKIHGATKTISPFLKDLRPLLDFTEAGANNSFDARDCYADHGFFEDSALCVTYLRVSNSGEPRFTANGGTERKQISNVAYLVELKPCPPRIDPLKLIELKVPRTSVITKLKAGESVTLEDGRVIRPEDVIANDQKAEQFPNLLVAEIGSEENLESIANNPMLHDYKSGGAKQIHHIVHFSPPHILVLKAHQEWLHSFGPNCRHLAVNGTGLPSPHSHKLYIGQNTMRTLLPEAFAELFPDSRQYEGKMLTQESPEFDIQMEQPVGANPILVPGFGRRFSMRGILGKDGTDAINMDFTQNFIENRIKEEPQLSEKISLFRKAREDLLEEMKASHQHGRPGQSPFPIVTFLGTASAKPEVYRNVSGHLLQTNAQTNLLIDCGDGTYGQMRVLFGPEGCVRTLAHLKAILVTHCHLDHTFGIFTIVRKRLEAMRQLEMPYKPLIVVCDRMVASAIRRYSQHFFDLQPYIVIVDLITQLVKELHTKEGEEPGRSLAFPLENLLPKEHFSPEDWNLHSIQAIHVLHTKWACAFAFTTDRERRKVVFSGDTMPSNNLEERANGADLLIHECTLEDGMEADALHKRHSTMRQAFDSARRMGAKNVIFSHFSARYSRVPPLPNYLLEAGNFATAMDYMTVPFHLVPLFPKLLPVFRLLFWEELLELENKSFNREKNPNRRGQRSRNGSEAADGDVSPRRKNRTKQPAAKETAQN